MAAVLVFQHNWFIPPGLLGEALRDRGVDVRVCSLGEGEAVPDHHSWDGVAVLGGVMGAYDEAEHPWLVEEKHYLADAVSRGIPTLGVCLGVQLLADALGGSAYRGDGWEYGLLDVRLTDAGTADPVVRHLDAPVPVFHGDTFDLPPGAVLLAETERYRHGFRLGSAVAVQSHPEASPDITDVWVMRRAGDIRAHGADPGALRAMLHAAEPAHREMSARFFGAWIDEVLGTS